MSETFNISANTMKALDQLYDKKVIDSKELFVELGIAVGLSIRRKSEVRNPKPFHTLSELDKGHVLSVIASTRNLEITTEEKMARELEMYAEAGIQELMDKDIKDDKLNYYRVLKKYSEI